MKKFIAFYQCCEGSENHSQWNLLSEEARQKKTESGIKAQEEWLQKSQSNLIYPVTSLGEAKRIDAHGVRDVPRQTGMFVMIQAETYDQAVELFINHPHFAIFPGDAIEIQECCEASQGLS